MNEVIGTFLAVALVGIVLFLATMYLMGKRGR